jgi:hypothetical protein
MAARVAHQPVFVIANAIKIFAIHCELAWFSADFGEM